MDALKFKTQKVDNHTMIENFKTMKNELLSSSQLSRLADVPVGQIFRLVNAGRLDPIAVNRTGKLKNLFFLVSQVDEVKKLIAFDPQPVC